MSNLDTIRFQKIYTNEFSSQDKNALVIELKKRKITYRLTQAAVLFDERYLKDVKDLVPSSLR